MAAPAICVVGSINLDMNAYVERFPRPGETLHGDRFTTGYGGKGANQAVMTARMGGVVTMIGRVGGRHLRVRYAPQSRQRGHPYRFRPSQPGRLIRRRRDHDRRKRPE
ncbi:MAG: hypothetical protein IPM07_12240 [Anaerolineales bacterium]|nr:hypothetical protein [Anaerolineales bacterium]